MRARKITVALLAAVVTVGLAGCGSGGENDQAGGAPASVSNQPVTPTDAPSEETSQTPSTAALDPCVLLTATDVAKYGTFNPAKKQSLGGARTCSYLIKLTSASDPSRTFNVAIRDKQGVDTVNANGGTPVEIKVDGRRAVRSPQPPAACLIALAVGDQARVDVGALANTTTEACQLADSIVKLVESRLPPA
jgi:hypothetical protein